LNLKINLGAKILLLNLDFSEQKANKFAARSLKIQLHQINLLIILSSLKINSIKLKLCVKKYIICPINKKEAKDE
jgi:hypothetical protein